VFAVARLDAAVASLPVLGVLRGGLGLVLLGLALGVAGAQLLRGRSLPLRVPPDRALFLGAAVVLCGLGFHYTGGLRVTGDEPHYLVMAQSLWREHDLDLRDNYGREDFREHTPGPIAPHYGAPRADGRPFPAHSPGLPLLLAPAYAAWHRRGTVVVLALAAAALLVQIRRLCAQASGDERGALWGVAAAAGPPVAFYAFHVYTEVPSALALTASLLILLGRPGPMAAGAAALLAGTLPWLHLKMIPAAAALGAIALWRLRGRSLAWFVGASAAMAAGFFVYYQAVFGTPNPLAIYGGVPRQALGSSPIRAAVGLLLDRSFGLLPHAPVFLLAFAGLPLLLRARWRVIGPHLVVALAVLAPLLTWRMWWGGQCPPGRFLVPLVPFLCLATAFRLREPPRGLARWRWALLTLSLGLAVFMTWRPGALLLVNRGPRPTRLWAALSAETPVARYLPSLVAAEPEDWRVAIIWLTAIGILLILDQLARRRDAVDWLFTGMGLPIVVFLLAGTAVDRWARPMQRAEANALALSATASTVAPEARVRARAESPGARPPLWAP
jgi:hypothetical protein